MHPVWRLEMRAPIQRSVGDAFAQRRRPFDLTVLYAAAGPPTVEDPLGQGWTDFKYKKTANTDKGRGTCKFYLIQEDAPERELVVVTGVEPRAGAKSYIYSVAPGIGEGVFRKRSVAEAWIKLHFLGIEEEAAPAQPVEPPPPKVICSVLEQCFGGDAPLAKWATQAASDECRSHAQEAVRLIRLLHCAAAGATPRVAGGAASPETNAFGCGPLRCEASGAAAQLDVLTAQELKEHEDKLLHHLSALDAEEVRRGRPRPRSAPSMLHREPRFARHGVECAWRAGIAGTAGRHGPSRAGREPAGLRQPTSQGAG